jgi:hypothetical protein
MHQRIFSWLFVCAFVATASLRAQVPATPGAAGVFDRPGRVLVAKLTGTARMTESNGKVTPLAPELQIPQSAKINTDQNSSVVLVFSNGASTRLEADTELVIEEFLQDPFPAQIKVSALEEEPTPSRTTLVLNRGELVGEVKKLRIGQNSSFKVKTPVGAAGIRGTTFRIVYRPTSSGQAFFNLSTASGIVAFDQGGNGGGNATTNQQGGATQGGGATNAAVTGSGTVTGLDIPQGQEIILNVTVTQNAAGQQVVTVQGPQGVTAINPTTLQQVINVSQEIAIATSQATFTSTTGSATGAPGTQTATISGQPAPGQTFEGQVQTAPTPATQPRIVPTTP